MIFGGIMPNLFTKKLRVIVDKYLMVMVQEVVFPLGENHCIGGRW